MLQNKIIVQPRDHLIVMIATHEPQYPVTTSPIRVRGILRWCPSVDGYDVPGGTRRSFDRYTYPVRNRGQHLSDSGLYTSAYLRKAGLWVLMILNPYGLGNI